ncbi:ribonuclease H-like protein [Athelia psychrophila]|uniref:Ribonuclease H-like protein n=1 Tax=Athelia psychrophila TaxID=1759441 RepID=A0A166WYA0_9AGAM|nr:ribonuclease H-like protein [Fibularhizoctonia sp. CBS 109695]
MPVERSCREDRPAPMAKRPSQRERVAAAKLAKAQSESAIPGTSCTSNTGSQAAHMGPNGNANAPQSKDMAGSSSQATSEGSEIQVSSSLRSSGPGAAQTPPGQRRRPLTQSATLPAKGSSLLPLYAWNDGAPNLQRFFIEDSDKLTVELERLLRDTDTIAFDMEWPWDKRQRKEGRVAVIQISSPSLVIVYGLPLGIESPLHPKIVELLTSNVIKVGNNIRGDMQKLYADFPSLPYFNCLLDFSEVARSVDGEQWAHLPYPCIALTDMVGHYLHVRLAGKADERHSDWTRRGAAMTKAQLDYASADVTVSLHLLERLKTFASASDLVKLTFTTSLSDKRAAKRRY